MAVRGPIVATGNVGRGGAGGPGVPRSTEASVVKAQDDVSTLPPARGAAASDAPVVCSASSTDSSGAQLSPTSGKARRPSGHARAGRRSQSRRRDPRGRRGDGAAATKSADDIPPPRVTCKAWGVADSSTGEVLLGFNQKAPRQIASITKVMTAHLVFQAAKAEPELIDELVLVSPEAASIGGTTASLRVGEVYTVHDLLYGMMLPSGNDAAAALAEYLGDSYDVPPDWKGRSTVDVHPWTRFVAEMNRAAARLGLKSTSFGNCHGLQHAKLRSTASDVLAMTAVVLNEPLFRKIVSTPVYRAHARVLRKAQPRGLYASQRSYPYIATWKNTNTLLGTTARASYPPGSRTPLGNYVFDGVKTGITKPAGGCLVTQLTRQGPAPRRQADEHEPPPDRERLLIVVLGSDGPRQRFTDTSRIAQYALTKLCL